MNTLHVVSVQPQYPRKRMVHDLIELGQDQGSSAADEGKHRVVTNNALAPRACLQTQLVHA